MNRNINYEEKATSEKPITYNDERFRRILNNSCEIKKLAQELIVMSSNKFGELLGNIPSLSPDKIAEEPRCWADRVLYEQDIAGDVIRNAIEIISAV